MKTFYTKSFFIVVLFIFSLSMLYAQTPQAINFQAIARDGSGNPMANTNLCIRLSVIDSAAGGAISYQELRALQTNANGSFSFQIGVNPDFTTEGEFQSIDWVTGNKFLKIDYDPTNTFTFNLSLGTIKFATVPYAFVAESVVFIDATGAQNGDVLAYNSSSGKFEPSAVTGTNYTAGIGISIVGNTISNTGDLSDTNEIQALSLDGATLSLSNGGGSVTLPTGTTYTAGDGINIAGNTISANDTSNTNEIQALSLDGATLSLSNGGGSVTLPTGTTYTAGNGINIAGNTISAIDASDTNELQTISISNDTIFLSKGGYVVLPSATGPTYKAPSAVTMEASSIQASQATLNGIANGYGLTTSVVFEWGTTSSYGNMTTATQSPITSEVLVSATISGLLSGTTYHFRIKAQSTEGTAYSDDMTFTTLKSLPQLTTAAIGSVPGATVTSGGNITHDGGSPIIDRGVCWSTNPSPTTSNYSTSSGTGVGTYTSNINGLSIGSTYYVRAYATNELGTAYGNQLSFLNAAVPTVTTSSVSDINGTSAKAGGAVTNNGGSAVTGQGLCWSTSPNPTIVNSKTTSFTDAMSGLSLNTVYYVRAYATNAVGTGYGAEYSFNSGYVIGSIHAGGLVFYNDGNGHGFVCAQSDQSTSASWGCTGTAIVGTSTDINTGAANTNAIVTGCAEASFAAKICSDLSLESYTDWYLPSLDELKLMYTNLHKKGYGNFSTTNSYWSSSQYNASLAWYAIFGFNPTYAETTKNYNFYVRAVRSF